MDTPTCVTGVDPQIQIRKPLLRLAHHQPTPDAAPSRRCLRTGAGPPVRCWAAQHPGLSGGTAPGRWGRWSGGQVRPWW